MTLDIQWFCSLAIDEGILTAELSQQLYDVYPDPPDLTAYAQGVLSNGLCDDMEKLQKLLNTAFENAQRGEEPPNKVGAGAAAAAAPIPAAEPLPAAEPIPAAEPAPAPAAEPAPPPAEPAPAPAPAAQGESAGGLPPISTPPSSADIPKSEGIPSFDGIMAKSDDECALWMKQLLMSVRDMGASDLHLAALCRPFVRLNLALQPLSEQVLSADEANRINKILLNPAQLQTFEADSDFDFALALDDTNRFRVNLMVHKDGVKGTYRLVPSQVKSLEELGFKNPDIISKLLDNHNGLILVTGPVGAGKTTTLASLVNILNERREDHVITVEEPIEIVQPSKNCNITQREVGLHTKSYGTALKGALREDPDIIVIGELRDLETIEMALTASETGHLVIGTLHTSDAATTLNRLLDVFPPMQQPQIRSMTAESLKGIVCQKLLPAIEGGVVVATEMMLVNLAVSNMIRENKTHLLAGVMQTGSKQGMCTMDQAVFELFEEGRISEEIALANIEDKQLKNRIKQPAPAVSAEPETKKKGWFK